MHLQVHCSQSSPWTCLLAAFLFARRAAICVIFNQQTADYSPTTLTGEYKRTTRRGFCQYQQQNKIKTVCIDIKQKNHWPVARWLGAIWQFIFFLFPCWLPGQLLRNVSRLFITEIRISLMISIGIISFSVTLVVPENSNCVGRGQVCGGRAGVTCCHDLDYCRLNEGSTSGLCVKYVCLQQCFKTVTLTYVFF